MFESVCRPGCAVLTAEDQAELATMSAGAAGVMTGEYPVMVSYPPGILDSHIVQLSLERFGIKNLYLNVRFRISDLI